MKRTEVADADRYLGEISDRFSSLARELDDTAEDAAGLDEETTERLRQLGYVE